MLDIGIPISIRTDTPTSNQWKLFKRNCQGHLQQARRLLCCKHIIFSLGSHGWLFKADMTASTLKWFCHSAGFSFLITASHTSACGVLYCVEWNGEISWLVVQELMLSHLWKSYKFLLIVQRYEDKSVFFLKISAQLKFLTQRHV